MKYLNCIQGKLDYLEKNININLNGRNVIITGANGVGKTTLLKRLHESIKIILLRDNKQYDFQLTHITQLKTQLNTLIAGTNDYLKIEQEVEYYENQIKMNSPPLNISFSDIENFIINYNNYKAINFFFEAMRIVSIQSATATTSIDSERVQAKQNYRHNSNQNTFLGSKLEQHLLNLKISQSLAQTEENDELKVNKFNMWFESFNRQLTFLFEGKNTKLNFNSTSRKFTIWQADKEFTFQDLSSGYQAIFNIYAELLMSSEMFDIPPNELEGIAIIDEIDVHLHISLQRIILPFFMNAFPNIQFIVSTHSPFVITSTDNTVVFDLTKNELIEEDLTNFSYDSIVKGLFHVKTTNGEDLNMVVQDINQLLDLKDTNISNLKEKIKVLEADEKNLDPNAFLTLMRAKNYILDNEAVRN